MVLKKQNIVYFLNSLENFGLPRHKQFQIADLYEPEKFYRVIECLEALAIIHHRQQEKELETQTHSSSEEIIVPSPTENQELTITKTPTRRPLPIPIPSSLKKTIPVAQEIQANVRKSFANNQQVSVLIHFENLSPIQQKKVIKSITSLQAHIRRRISHRRYEKRLTDSEYRKNIAEEMLNTEMVYVSQLIALQKVTKK